MYLGECVINQYLTFAICAKSPTTFAGGGQAVDADSNPSYRIYEEETATPILTGTMTKLDDAGTIGFYSEKIQLTAAAGFEKAKCYNIYVYYEISSVGMTELKSFQMRDGSYDPLINYLYGHIGIPSDIGGGATISQNVVDINSILNYNYARIGTPSDLGSGATLGDNNSDIDTAINNVYGRVGAPIDLGDGDTDIVSMLTAMAGKTAGAASYNRLYDSQEGLADSESDNVTLVQMKDLLFKRNVTNRHANGKPQLIDVGDAATGTDETVTTTLDTAVGMTDYIKIETY